LIQSSSLIYCLEFISEETACLPTECLEIYLDLRERKEVQGGWTIFQNGKFHNLYSSPDITTLNKSGKIRWIGAWNMDGSDEKCITTSTHDLYYHQNNLTQFQKGTCYVGVKIFNYLCLKLSLCLMIRRALNLSWQHSYYRILFILLRSFLNWSMTINKIQW
jgi:hypothetical protein